MSLKLVEVEFSVWPFVKAAKRAFWASESVQNRSRCDRVRCRCQCVVLDWGLHVNVVDVPQSKAQCLGLH